MTQNVKYIGVMTSFLRNKHHCEILKQNYYY